MNQNSYNREELLRMGRGELLKDSPARLPLPNMLMMDRITRIAENEGAYKRGLITAELDIDPSLWFFACHFESDPVMPGCLGLDALWQLAGFFLPWIGLDGKGRALGVKEVKFTGQILPGAKLVTYRVDVRRVFTKPSIIIVADGTVDVDGRRVYTTSGLRVGLFESTEGF